MDETIQKHTQQQQQQQKRQRQLLHLFDWMSLSMHINVRYAWYFDCEMVDNRSYMAFWMPFSFMATDFCTTDFNRIQSNPFKYMYIHCQAEIKVILKCPSHISVCCCSWLCIISICSSHTLTMVVSCFFSLSLERSDKFRLVSNKSKSVVQIAIDSISLWSFIVFELFCVCFFFVGFSLLLILR